MTNKTIHKLINNFIFIIITALLICFTPRFTGLMISITGTILIFYLVFILFHEDEPKTENINNKKQVKKYSGGLSYEQKGN